MRKKHLTAYAAIALSVSTLEVGCSVAPASSESDAIATTSEDLASCSGSGPQTTCAVSYCSPIGGWHTSAEPAGTACTTSTLPKESRIEPVALVRRLPPHLARPSLLFSVDGDRIHG